MAERTGSLQNYVSRVQHALYSSVLEKGAPTSQLIQTIRRPGISRTEQIFAGVQITDNVLSSIGVDGFKSALFEIFHDPSDIPLATPVDLIGRGYEHNVYMLIDDTSDKPYVLKAYKNVHHLNPKQLIIKAQQVCDDHDRIAAMYRHIPELVPPSSVFVAQLPFRNGISIGVLQPYIEGALTDIFRDVSEEEVEQLCVRNPHFHDMLSAYITTTLHAWDHKGIISDIGGNNNVSIVNIDTDPKLVLLDTYGFFSSNKISKRDKKTQDHMTYFINRLRGMRTFLTRLEAGTLPQEQAA